MTARPLVATCLAGSFTGRIWHPDQPILGSPRDRHQLEWLRCQADVLLYGAGTARADRREIRFTDARIAAERARRHGTTAVPPIAVLAHSADFDFTSPFWATPTTKTLILPRHAATDAKVPGDVEVCRLPDTADLSSVLALLADQGHARVLCEGGGRLHSALTGQHLLDELFYTITPWSLGGDAPAITPSPLPPQRFTLIEAQVVGQEIFLRYRTPTGRAWTTQPLPGAAP